MVSKLLDNASVVLSFRLGVEQAIALEEGEPMTVSIKGIPFKIQRQNGGKQQ